MNSVTIWKTNTKIIKMNSGQDAEVRDQKKKPAKRFQGLVVRQKSHEFVLEAYFV